MFEKYSGIINLDEVLKDEYGYVFDGVEQNFYDQDFAQLEGNGKDALCWVRVLDERFIFKPLHEFEYNVWGELMSEEIAKKLGIACAEYRVGSLHGKMGIISKSFLKDDETLVLGSEVFQNFFNRKFYHKGNHDDVKRAFDNKEAVLMYEIPAYYEKLDAYNQRRYTFNYLNNLEQVWAILNEDDSISEKEVTEMVRFFSKMLLFDIITLEGDRHPNNWGIIKGKTGAWPSPLFDNSASFGLGFFDMEKRVNDFRNEVVRARSFRDEKTLYSFIYEARPNFTLSQDNMVDIKNRIKDSAEKVFSDFIEKSDEETRLGIKNILESIDIDEFDKMKKRVEEKNDIRMRDDVYFYISTVFEMNINCLKKIIDDYERKFSDDKSKRIR